MKSYRGILENSNFVKICLILPLFSISTSKYTDVGLYITAHKRDIYTTESFTIIIEMLK